MADQKISQLTELDQGSVATGDEIAIVDKSATETKKFTWASIRGAIASYLATLTQTLTNKTIDLTDNTVTGTLAEFNTAVSDATLDDTGDTRTPASHGNEAHDDDFATLTGAETFTNKRAIGSIDTKTSNYTLVLTDASKTIRMNLAGANTLTIPPNSSVAFEIGARIMIRQVGAGSTTVTAGAGVTLNAPASVAAEIDEQHGSRGIEKVATDTWEIV